MFRRRQRAPHSLIAAFEKAEQAGAFGLLPQDEEFELCSPEDARAVVEVLRRVSEMSIERMVAWADAAISLLYKLETDSPAVVPRAPGRDRSRQRRCT
jgi:hypothetical protein